MFIHTRFSLHLKKIKVSIKNKFCFLQSTFSLILFFLVFGFFVGNFFGTFLFLLRNFFVWDGFLIIFLIFTFEFINYCTYHQISNKFFMKSSHSRFYIKLSNYFKIGFIFGFFVDAFKVGS